MVAVGGDSIAVKIGVFAALSYDVTSANLSSPQTFELNSAQRAPTLNKWLKLNVTEGILWGIGGSLLDGTPYPLIGSILGIASMYIKYQYAIKAGEQSGLPDMEDHSTGQYNLNGGSNGDYQYSQA
jgi:hypothetical protein